MLEIKNLSATIGDAEILRVLNSKRAFGAHPRTSAIGPRNAIRIDKVCNMNITAWVLRLARWRHCASMRIVWNARSEVKVLEQKMDDRFV